MSRKKRANEHCKSCFFRKVRHFMIYGLSFPGYRSSKSLRVST